MRWVVLLLLITSTRAHAEPCGAPIEAHLAVVALEAVARSPDAKRDASYLDRCFRELGEPTERRPTLVERFFTACQPILAREPAHKICISGAVHQGKKGLWGVDFFAAVAGWAQGPWTPTGMRALELYALLENPRAVPIFVETWKASTDDATQREQAVEGWQQKQTRRTWSRWQQQAAVVIGALGEAEVLSFLAERAETKDRAVARACRDAIRAIERREAKRRRAAPP